MSDLKTINREGVGMKVIFANMFQGMIYLRQEKGKQITDGCHPEKYIEYFVRQQPDILCLAETLADDAQGNSLFVTELSKACKLPYFYCLAGEKAWLAGGGKYYGLAVLSRFPIVNYSVEKLANPGLELTRPNGEHWVMHDKYIQKTVIEANHQKLSLFNTHLFPFQHFRRRFWDDEFKPYRDKWLRQLMPCDGPAIICGDFNTVGISLEKAFPELFERGLTNAVPFNGKDYQPRYAYDTQIEYLLVSPEVRVKAGLSDMLYSDHPFLIADIHF